MAVNINRRDYSLGGPEDKRAQEKGIASAEWYASPIPRQKMKELMKRKDGPAIRDTIIWFALLGILGYLAYLSWGTWWAIPAFAAYGAVYALPGNSRWHEASHGTMFKTPWMNEVIYQIASFMNLFPATPWRWSHARHHTDTYIVGRDPEIHAPRPPVWRVLAAELFRLIGGVIDLKRVLLHAFGKMDKEELEYIPASEFKKAYWEARVWILIFLAVIAACIYTGSILPAMFIVLPTFYGFYAVMIVAWTQHLGLNEDVLDHRLNTRTVYMNPIIRFLYCNMNYHIEHHMFPMVPYHALPKLHEEMKGDCPPASPSLWAALMEVFTALRKQRKDPTYTIVRKLPETARPYKYGPAPYGTVAPDATLMRKAE
ncbi:fatty acid desaturase family protein [Paenibacillus validus]|uniref:Fatty acid desaturase n=1 Tax=Paenibacillus validus TaxID=44253 RepID=A0A7X3CVA4_9BACL|nr:MULTISPECIES: fatty acid desaturase family protein [Paenibacillus]MED4601399.1 fatty acid desaturase family protein [Paenibacillus validus]MED4605056.1 fatty acid desaturase family protein [Paenibacillus validus]MUG72909.1 fatty acid desaturase [Paenibacillus validus]